MSIKEIIAQLSQPFDPSDIKWKPQTVDYKAKTALAVAHADPRAYIDRLNEVLGPEGWGQEFRFIATEAPKFIKGKKAWKAPADAPIPEDKTVPGFKVLAICRLTINGIGVHESTGDSDAADDNAATSAEAQAFKRACLSFGLGRYLYDLPKQTVGYDGGQFLYTPILPDWAIPKTDCEDCSSVIGATEWKGQEYNVTQIVNNAVKKYNKKLCMECQRKRSTGISR